MALMMWILITIDNDTFGILSAISKLSRMHSNKTRAQSNVEMNDGFGEFQDSVVSEAPLVMNLSSMNAQIYGDKPAPISIPSPTIQPFDETEIAIPPILTLEPLKDEYVQSQVPQMKRIDLCRSYHVLKKSICRSLTND